MVPLATPDHVRDIASRIGRLRPDWGNPERYFEERDQLRRDLHALARTLERHRHG